MHSTMLRFTVLCIFAWSVMQCGPGAISVRVHVKDVTTDVTSLYVNAILNGMPAMQGAEFTQQLSQFTIKLPVSDIGQGQLTINIAGLGIDHCKISTARTDIQVKDNVSVIDLDLSLVLLPSKLCTKINLITPPLGPVGQGIKLQLDGQNFTEGAAVTVAGMSASEVKIIGPGSLTAVVPVVPNAFGRTEVVVRTPDGQSASRSDLFAYYATQISFAKTTFSIGSFGQRALVIGDFNGDLANDIVIFDGNGTRNVLLGNGAGGFATAKTTIGTGRRIDSIAVGDFNGDQKQDLVATDIGNGNINILLGDGTGGFGMAKTVASGLSANSIVVNDFNIDQKPDLAVTSDSVYVLLGDGAGGFGPAKPFPVGQTPTSVAVGDFNGDQRSDLAVANYTDRTTTVLFGDGKGGFAMAKTLMSGSGTRSVTVADFNVDHRLDLLVTGEGNMITVLLGDGQGGFGPAKTITSSSYAGQVAVADYDGDGNPDLITIGLNLLLGDGKGGFGSAKTFDSLSGTQLISVADFNGDHKPDVIAVGDPSAGSLSLNVSQ